MKCEECGSEDAKTLCLECDEALCYSCDETLHKGGKRKSHLRPAICNSCRNGATLECGSCGISICPSCSKLHPGHSTKPIHSPKRFGVFWDLESCTPAHPEEVPQVISEISARIGAPEFIRAYGDGWGKYREALLAGGAEPVFRQGIKDTEAILLDMSVFGSSGLTHILLVTSHAQVLRPHLMQLKSNLSYVSIMISPKILPLVPVELEKYNEEKSLPLRTKTKNFRSEVSEFQPQEYQKFCSRGVFNDLLEYLREEAFRGYLIHELNELKQTISHRFKLRPEQVDSLLKSAEKERLVHFTKREFEDFGNYEFVSLQLKSLSMESLLWCLRSLRCDEMLPTEKAIQSRIKEVFGLKPSNSQWNQLIQKLKGHSHSSSAPTEFSLFSSSQFSLPKFDIRNMCEPVTGCETMLIYPRGEEWVALDQNSKYGDYLHIKLTDEWNDFISFLENYFCGRKKRRRNRREEEVKSIPGGRYGCAQFLKLCGPSVLQHSSLGKLSYMVQLAINEDILRYQRTLLVWTSDYKTNTSNDEIQRKLNLVQSAIITILSNTRNGISLAQLPNSIRRHLGFTPDISELGFAKLKDLLQTIPEVSIELRGNNHPFAVLRQFSPTFKHTQEVESVVEFIKTILQTHKFGLSEAKLEKMLESKGHSVNWTQYNCCDITEFLHVYANSVAEVVKTGDTSMVFKIDESKNIFYSPFENPFNSAVLEHTRTGSPIFHTASSSYDMRNSIAENQFHGPMQKIINVSTLPAELAKMRVPPFEAERIEKQKKFWESLYEGSQDLSTRLAGTHSPHYRTDTVYYHSNNPSLGKIDYETHARTQSEDLGIEFPNYHTRQHYSWFENWGMKPPPGFG